MDETEQEKRKKEMGHIVDLAEEYLLTVGVFITKTPSRPDATNFSETLGFAIGILVDIGKEVNEKMTAFNKGIGQKQ